MPKMITKLEPITLTANSHRIHMRRARTTSRTKLDRKIPAIIAMLARAIRSQQQKQANIDAAITGGERVEVEKVGTEEFDERELIALEDWFGKLVTRVDDGTDEDEDAITDRSAIIEYFQYAGAQALVELIGMARFQLSLLDQGYTVSGLKADAEKARKEAAEALAHARDTAEADRDAEEKRKAEAEDDASPAPDPETGG